MTFQISISERRTPKLCTVNRSDIR